MSITVEITPELEEKLQKAAIAAGITPDAYIIETLQGRLAQTTQRLSPKEADLLAKINTSLSQIEWTRYYALLDLRRAETLTSDEQTELIALSDRIEEANAQRIFYLAELARIRNTTLDALIDELGLKRTPDN